MLSACGRKPLPEDYPAGTGELPCVYITTRDDSGRELDGSNLEKGHGYIRAEIVICDADGVQLNSVEGAQIKVRGNASAQGAKKPYAIRFDEKQNLFSMGAARRYNLIANLYDPTMLRNAIALQLSKSMEMEGTPDYRFAEVWVDGNYQGLYQLCEAINVNPHRVPLREGTDDFLIMRERERENPGAVYLVTEAGLRYELCWPENPTTEQVEEIKHKLDELWDCVEKDDYNQLKTKLDVESFMKYYLLEELFKTIDYNFSSGFMYYKNGKLYAGPAWDFDISCGNIDVKRGEAFELPASVESWHCMTEWSKRLYENQKPFYRYYYEVLDRYEPLFRTTYEPGGIIDTLTAAMPMAIEANRVKAGWDPGLSYNEGMRDPDPTYEENVEFLRSWLHGRVDWIVDHSEH